MILGFVEDGDTQVLDQYSTGTFGPHPEDTELGGTDDILIFSGAEEDGATTIEFKRLLITGDTYDIDITEGTNKIIWGYSSSDNPVSKHSKRGYGEIDL